MKILVVDDFEDARAYLELELLSQGHEIITANNGQQALNLARKDKPDLIISDGLMPIMDGFELCRQLKRDQKLKSVPFIFYTGSYVEKRDTELALELGAARYLIKPMEPEPLLQAIDEVMAESQQATTAVEDKSESEILELHRDVLARKLDKKIGQLEEQQQRFQRLESSLASEYIFYSHGVDGIFTYVSPSVSSMLGYEPEEFLVHYTEYLTENPENQAATANTEAALQGEKLPSYELEIFHKDGSRRWLDISEFPVTNEQGEVVSIEGVAHDVTRLKQVREAVSELASKNALILESAGEGIFGLDLDGNHTFVNPAAVEMLGWSREELLGKNSHTTWHHTRPDGRHYPAEECPIQAVLKTGTTQKGEETFIRKDGSFFPVDFTSTPIIKGEEIVGTVVSFLDISERKTHEQQLRRSLEQTVQAVAFAMEQRDPYTAGHQREVAKLAKAIAQSMALPEEEIEGLHVSGIIHDIGKIAIPADLLNKPGRLTKTEFKLIQTHVNNGVDIIDHIDFPWPVKDIVEQHHERLDGSGYPQGLKGDQIIKGARILAVADVVEAMSSHRPYRASLGIDAALDEIKKGRGTLYDADTVDHCVRLFEEQGYTFTENH